MQAIHWTSAHKTQCRTIDLMAQESSSGSTNSAEDIPKGMYSFFLRLHFTLAFYDMVQY